MECHGMPWNAMQLHGVDEWCRRGKFTRRSLTEDAVGTSQALTKFTLLRMIYMGYPPVSYSVGTCEVQQYNARH